MVINVRIPDLSARVEGFPNYWMHLIFAGNRPQNNVAHALVNGYIRLTEAAVRFYERGRLLTLQGWNMHSRLALGNFNDAATSFESCVTDLYRGATFMTRVRGSVLFDEAFKAGLGKKPTFVSRIDDIRKLRRAIHHLDADIVSGKIPEGKPIFLMSGGDILKEDGTEIKVIDHLQVGDTQIHFSQIATRLSEMTDAAAYIAAYNWKRSHV